MHTHMLKRQENTMEMKQTDFRIVKVEKTGNGKKEKRKKKKW